MPPGSFLPGPNPSKSLVDRAASEDVGTESVLTFARKRSPSAAPAYVHVVPCVVTLTDQVVHRVGNLARHARRISTPATLVPT
jgi:hypothetical protein